jgi:serine/threonine protein kinase
MSTFISEPGTRLGGRYRLEDRVSDASGWSAWKAIDEILARPVGVLTFAPGFPRISEVLTAARAASRLTDARLAQVFDVEDDWDSAYVVMEWVAGDSLDDLLADGPLDPARGAEIVAEAAEALAAAHASGVPHLCLTPQSLRWTPGGGVKVLGAGIDAALSDTSADDPALADTRGLAMLLYAALTRYWPGPGMGTLPPAPLADGKPCSPRQVCAGVPASIDEVTTQALFQRERRRGPPLTTPALFAEALAEVIPAPLAPPPAAPPSQPSRNGGFPRSGDYGSAAPYGGEPPSDYPGTQGWTPSGSGRPYAPPPRSRRPMASRLAIVLVVLLVLAAIGTGVYSLTRKHGSGGGSPGKSSSSSASPSNAANTVLTPVGAEGYDALGLASDPGDEDNAGAKLAIDNNPSTAWHTQFYLSNPVFGGLKQGTGLLLDMGKQVTLRSVQVTFGSTAGANVAIEVGNSNAISAQGLASFARVAKLKHVAAGPVTFQTSSASKGRYVLIWFTKLPPNPSNNGQFEAFIYNVVVRGSG